MKASIVSVPLRDWLLKKPEWLDDETTVAVTFAVKTFVAGLLALYVALWPGRAKMGAFDGLRSFTG